MIAKLICLIRGHAWHNEWPVTILSNGIAYNEPCCACVRCGEPGLYSGRNR